MYRLMFATLIAVLLTTGFSSEVAARDFNRANYPYSRKDFGCLSPLDKVIDINTGATILCKFADLDHRVSLKEAFNAKLSNAEIRKLAKDKNNLVWTQSSINRAKGSLSSSEFEDVLKNRNEYDGRRYNKHLRASIATKQEYGIPLDSREKSYAYKALNVAPSKKVKKFVPALKFDEAVEKVTRKYGAKVARKAAFRVGGSFVPGAGWVTTGVLVTGDLGWWVLTGECAVCSATTYLLELTSDRYVDQYVQNPVPLLEYEEVYHISPTSHSEIQSEYDHLTMLLETDPWLLNDDTKLYESYQQELNTEIIKRKFSN